MKGLVTFAIIAGALVLLGYYGLGTLLAEGTDQMVAFASGNPYEDRVEIQIAVPIALTRVDPPRTKVVGDMVVELWDEWIAEHFRIYTGSEDPITLERKHFANLIPERKVGTPDSYLIGWVDVGKTYTFDFTPNVTEGKAYRYEFTPTQDGPAFSREIFEPVK